MNTCPTSFPTPTVFVVDDDVSVRQSLEPMIRSAGWQPKISASAGEFLARPRVFAPSCLVLDVKLPDIDGFELQRIVADRAELPVIFITGHGNIPMAVQAVKSGAVEFLTKPFGRDVLLSAVRHALTRSYTALRHEARLRVIRDRHLSLTVRQREVMELTVCGYLNKQIAAELGISEITVKCHRGQVMRKMNAASLVDLVKMTVALAGVDQAKLHYAPLQCVRWGRSEIF